MTREQDRMAQYSLRELAAECQQQMQHFEETRQSDTRFCLELLRRAFDAGETDAGDLVYAQFAPMLARWLGSKLDRNQSEDVIQETFARLLAQSRVGRFQVASYSLPQVLQFIKRCALIVVKEHRHPHPHTLPDVAAYPGVALDLRQDLEAVLASVRGLLLPEEWAALVQRHFREQQPTDATPHRLKSDALGMLLRRKLPADDLALFELRYARNVPPREIARQFGIEVQQVYRRLATIMRRLRNDSDLAHLFPDPES